MNEYELNYPYHIILVGGLIMLIMFLRAWMLPNDVGPGIGVRAFVAAHTLLKRWPRKGADT
ncbi:MAG: hypothetical protein JW932_06205 [Deltaproteobacteria bacterium]|nr:hypothetical protein [Deltaproteobacteria bacterium]